MQSLVAGTATGAAMVLGDPLSFWGGLDPATGTIIDVRHPRCGESVTGTILLMPHGRGSSGASGIIAEALRLGTAPAAIVITGADAMILVGVVVAAHLYGTSIPVVVIDRDTFESIRNGDRVHIEGDHFTVEAINPSA